MHFSASSAGTKLVSAPDPLYQLRVDYITAYITYVHHRYANKLLQGCSRLSTSLEQKKKKKKYIHRTTMQFQVDFGSTATSTKPGNGKQLRLIKTNFAVTIMNMFYVSVGDRALLT